MAKPCSCCGEIITTATEYELDFSGTLTILFHRVTGDRDGRNLFQSGQATQFGQQLIAINIRHPNI